MDAKLEAKLSIRGSVGDSDGIGMMGPSVSWERRWGSYESDTAPGDK